MGYHLANLIHKLSDQGPGLPLRSMEGLLKCSVNYVPLTPISFLERAANVFRGRISIIDGSSVKYTWKETHARCIKLASALSNLGISRGDVKNAILQQKDTLTRGER
ncbi:hypothetical protein FXO38_28214 [Capsicum annuum]|nr:hypothetical protein FXO38_28214 [Capsicum annuum]KAF3634887.1 hypothetical protein FXO37_26236 [Capsicum annuum]